MQQLAEKVEAMRENGTSQAQAFNALSTTTGEVVKSLDAVQRHEGQLKGLLTDRDKVHTQLQSHQDFIYEQANDQLLKLRSGSDNTHESKLEVMEWIVRYARYMHTKDVFDAND